MQSRPSLPAARGDFKGKEGKKKGKRKALLSLSLGGGRGGVMEPMGVILGALSRQGRCCGDKVWGVLPPPFPAPPLR